MKSRHLILSVLIGFAAIAATERDSRAALPGCMKCHGDEAAMKSMVKPVIPVSSEGEG